MIVSLSLESLENHNIKSHVILKPYNLKIVEFELMKN